METKVCWKCKRELSIVKFSKNSKTKDGYSGRCKECDAEYKKIYYETHREFISERQAYFRNRNPELTKARKRAEYEKNREKYLEYQRQYRINNAEKKRAMDKRYAKTHAEKIRENKRKYQTKRRKEDVQLRLKEQTAHRISEALKRQGYKKTDRTVDILGCTIPELKKHLEAQFTEGMTWENYGEWHIDHIIPCIAFDLSKKEEMQKCFNYKNLQPLWAKENYSKQDFLPNGKRGKDLRK